MLYTARTTVSDNHTVYTMDTENCYLFTCATPLTIGEFKKLLYFHSTIFIRVDTVQSPYFGTYHIGHCTSMITLEHFLQYFTTCNITVTWVQPTEKFHGNVNVAMETVATEETVTRVISFFKNDLNTHLVYKAVRYQHTTHLQVLYVTMPLTHGVFNDDSDVIELCLKLHPQKSVCWMKFG